MDDPFRLVSGSLEKLRVLVVDRWGKKHDLPLDVVACCSAGPASIKPTADMAELKKLTTDLDHAVLAQAEDWDATALKRAFAPVLEMVQARQSDFEHRICLSRKVLPASVAKCE